MTRHLSSFGEMALVLVEAELSMHEHLSHGLERAAQIIEKTAKDELGHYQPGAGPFPAWPELADSTKEDRLQQGYSENDPLLRSGDLRDSISHEVDGLEAIVGSTSDIAVFQELGTSKMPARPFLGPAAFNNRRIIEKLIGAAAISGLIGADEAAKVLGLSHAQAEAFGAGQARIHADLGYDFTTKD